MISDNWVPQICVVRIWSTGFNNVFSARDIRINYLTSLEVRSNIGLSCYLLGK